MVWKARSAFCSSSKSWILPLNFIFSYIVFAATSILFGESAHLLALLPTLYHIIATCLVGAGAGCERSITSTTKTFSGHVCIFIAHPVPLIVLAKLLWDRPPTLAQIMGRTKPLSVRLYNGHLCRPTSPGYPINCGMATVHRFSSFLQLCSFMNFLIEGNKGNRVGLMYN